MTGVRFYLEVSLWFWRHLEYHFHAVVCPLKILAASANLVDVRDGMRS